MIEVGVPQNDRAFALVEHGKAYAICLVGSGPAELTLNMPAEEFDAEWIETADGSVVKKGLLHTPWWNEATSIAKVCAGHCTSASTWKERSRTSKIG